MHTFTKCFLNLFLTVGASQGFEPLVHFVVLFVALTLLRIDLKEALALSLLALTPDIDALLLAHRSFTYSILFMLTIAAPTLLALHKLNSRFRRYGFLGLLSVALQLMLDLPARYTSSGRSGYSLRIKAELAAHLGSTPTLTLNVHILTKPIVFESLRSLDAPLFTGAGLATSLPYLQFFSQKGKPKGSAPLKITRLDVSAVEVEFVVSQANLMLISSFNPL
ncbi:MAG: hypothetical protein QW158_05475 [Nitrososphaerales archaeon]